MKRPINPTKDYQTWWKTCDALRTFDWKKFKEKIGNCALNLVFAQ